VTTPRDRGTYGSIDRAEHPVVGWVADETIDYARDRTIGATLRPMMPAIGDVYSGARGARRLWYAGKVIGGRREAEKPPTQIGQELFHTVADRERAITQIGTGFRALVSDLAVWQTANMGHPDAGVNAQWFAADVTPTLEEFNDFVEHERGSWWTRLATSWDTFEGWWERLRQLRALARAHGIMLQSAELLPLPKTIWQKSAEGKGTEATAVLGVLKIGVLSALAVMGAAGLYGAIRGLRSKAKAAIDREQLREVLREELRGRDLPP
jgi:hypothetical protein